MKKIRVHPFYLLYLCKKLFLLKSILINFRSFYRILFQLDLLHCISCKSKHHCYLNVSHYFGKNLC